MQLNDIEDFKKFIKQYINSFDGSSKENPLHVEKKFDLSPRDYLAFAEEELNKNTSVSLINCVAHLKRALDCQLDSFFHVFNLFNLFKKRNLKIEKKLQFIGAIGYLNSRSLIRLNSIRNKMEHHYAIPEIEDIEVYFDLITALVQLLELGSFESSGCDFFLENSDIGYHNFKICYSIDNPEINIVLSGYDESLENINVSIKADSDIDSFAYYFKALRLLNIFWDRQGGHEYILKELGIT